MSTSDKLTEMYNESVIKRDKLTALQDERTRLYTTGIALLEKERDDLLADNRNLRETMKHCLSIKDLWLLCGDVGEEHKGEAQALSKMYDRMKASVEGEK